jgi:hypothetical protein
MDTDSKATLSHLATGTPAERISILAQMTQYCTSGSMQNKTTGAAVTITDVDTKGRQTRAGNRAGITRNGAQRHSRASAHPMKEEKDGHPAGSTKVKGGVGYI